MRMTAIFVGAILGLGAVAPAAAIDAIEARQTILKGMGDEARPLAAMLKGEAGFDLARVKAALKIHAEGAEKLKDLYPDNSRTGKTEASPRIWVEKERFLGLYAKLAADAKAAEASIADEASFKAQFPKVLADCKACHDDYRVKK
jgi:cytochrome c556